MKRLISVVCLTILLVSTNISANADIIVTPPLSAAFSLIEESNPMVQKYEEVAGQVISGGEYGDFLINYQGSVQFISENPDKQELIDGAIPGDYLVFCGDTNKIGVFAGSLLDYGYSEIKYAYLDDYLNLPLFIVLNEDSASISMLGIKQTLSIDNIQINELDLTGFESWTWFRI